jgi:signal transduction histidine kinase
VTLFAIAVAGFVAWFAWRYGDPWASLGLAGMLGQVAAGVVWAVSGAFLVTVRPRNVVGWLLLAVGACQALFIGLMVFSWYGITIADPAWATARWTLVVGAGLYVPGWLALPTLLIAFYPDGRLPARWWRWPVGGAATGILLLTVIAPFDPVGYVGAPAVPSLLAPKVVLQILLAGICLPLMAGSTLAIWIGTVVRFVRARSPERQQLAWLACVVGAFLATSLYEPAKPLLTIIAFAVPVAIAVGVLRYRLLGITVVLRRGLVYAVLTAAVVAVYLAVTAVTAQALGHTPIPGVMAAAVVAVGLTPARDQLQRAVDRFIYGHRPDPMQALGHLGDLVADADEAELLHTALQSVAGSVGATGAAVVASDGHVVSSVGTDPASYEIGPLRFGGQNLGTLQLATRYAPPQSRSPAERRLHAALTSQVAVVVRAVKLTEELKAERDRVVTATRDERDRLRRDLHDGLGPSLSGVSLGLQALTDAVETNNKAACEALLERIGAEVATAVHDIRRIIDDLRPAALDRLSLADAVSRHAASLTGPITVTVTATGPRRLPPNVETAAYRIVTEALTNITRHANAHHAQVDITTDDQTLRLSIADDGAGGADTGPPGVGLTSMRRRAETLHGSCTIDSTTTGTTVAVTLPLDNS